MFQVCQRLSLNTDRVEQTCQDVEWVWRMVDWFVCVSRFWIVWVGLRVTFLGKYVAYKNMINLFPKDMISWCIGKLQTQQEQQNVRWHVYAKRGPFLWQDIPYSIHTDSEITNQSMDWELENWYYLVGVRRMQMCAHLWPEPCFSHQTQPSIMPTHVLNWHRGGSYWSMKSAACYSYCAVHWEQNKIIINATSK